MGSPDNKSPGLSSQERTNRSNGPSLRAGLVNMRKARDYEAKEAKEAKAARRSHREHDEIAHKAKAEELDWWIMWLSKVTSLAVLLFVVGCSAPLSYVAAPAKLRAPSVCFDNLCGGGPYGENYCSCHETSGGRRCWTTREDCEVDRHCCASTECAGMTEDVCTAETRRQRAIRVGAE